MQIVLRANSNDPGGFKASFDAQLAKLGGKVTLVSEEGPYRVDSSDSYYFEMRRVYELKL